MSEGVMQSDDAAPPGPPGSDMIREGDHLILQPGDVVLKSLQLGLVV